VLHVTSAFDALFATSQRLSLRLIGS
jgi:hypothetical protein